MSRTRALHFDFRGGLNLSHSQEVLDARELRFARNARSGEYGAVAKRAGTRRIHESSIGGGAPILGLFQWIPTGGRETVAVANGNLYHKAQGAGDFTETVADLSTAVRPDFAPHRIGADPRLFLADGKLRMWDGTTLSEVTGGIVPGAVRIQVYKTRMFATDGSKWIYWSRIDNPTDWELPFAGQAPVETYSDEGLVALEVVGSSLLLFKENSIARFTGVSSENIRIDQETEGISADVGTIAPNTVVRMEEAVFFLTDRGPYIATEAGVQAVGVNVEPAFDDAELDHLPNAVAVHHKGRREVWIFFPENTETTNTVGYCLNYRLQNWSGPWDMGGFDVASAAMYERADRTESVLLGGYDGWVRNGDAPEVGARDDVLRNGTGGLPVTMDLELPTLVFGDPTAWKRMNPTQQLAADLKNHGNLVVTTQGQGFPTEEVAFPSEGPGERQYLWAPGTQGRRITMRLRDSTPEIVQVNGLMLEAERVRRAV